MPFSGAWRVAVGMSRDAVAVDDAVEILPIVLTRVKEPSRVGGVVCDVRARSNAQSAVKPVRKETVVSEKFALRMKDREVVHDTVVLADFVQIWCDGHHRDRARQRVETDGALLGIYGRKPVDLCAECEAHLSYAEKRRAFCPKDPKPFCAHCDTHCYKSEEREWQREMMRYSGPKSWRKGHAIDGIKHLLEARRYRKQAEMTTAKASGAPATQDQEESR